jgi:phosphatidylinositol kinase/protein kinase (PI-3  family)
MERPLPLKCYQIITTGARTGLIETLIEATSLDGLIEAHGAHNLKDHFKVQYRHDPSMKARAITNFVSSLAAQSVATYMLAVKDRHNGNVMISSDGSIFNIDFGFLLGIATGFFPPGTNTRLAMEEVRRVRGCWSTFEALRRLASLSVCCPRAPVSRLASPLSPCDRWRCARFVLFRRTKPIALAPLVSHFSRPCPHRPPQPPPLHAPTSAHRDRQVAPFKLTKQMVALLEEENRWDDFVSKVCDGIEAIAKHGDEMCTLLAIMGHHSKYEFYVGHYDKDFPQSPEKVVNDFRARYFHGLTKKQRAAQVKLICARSKGGIGQFGTWSYDQFQKMSNGIQM